MNTHTASDFIRENFEPGDRLAVVLLNRRRQEVIQRLASAENIAASDLQTWLRHKNDAERFEIYLSVNALKDSAEGRTKADVATVRHLFLDFDDNGTAAVEKLIQCDDLPKPNYVTSTSPGKWQVIWKVKGFAPEQAEHQQRTLSRQTGADIAATDCSRVLRLPGFYNHKYTQRHLVTVEKLSDEIYGVERFPAISEDERGRPATAIGVRRNHVSLAPSQSEKDWAFAKRALAHGDSHEDIVTAIATFRRFEKHNPRYYAELTVSKAAQSLVAEQMGERLNTSQPER
jgi:hypothetical protein